MLMDAETVLELSATQAAATNFQINPAARPPSDTTQDRTLGRGGVLLLLLFLRIQTLISQERLLILFVSRLF